MDTPEYKFCTQCGAKLHYADRFCTQCGAKCTDTGTAAAAPVQAQDTQAAEAAFAQGQHYLSGQGVPKDFSAALRSFTEAAQAGHKEAPVWAEISKRYLDIVQLRRQADAIHQGVPADEAAQTYPVAAGVMPEGAAPVAGGAGHGMAPQAAMPGQAFAGRSDMNHSGREGYRDMPGYDRRNNGGGSNIGKYVAGAAIGATAATLLNHMGTSTAYASGIPGAAGGNTYVTNNYGTDPGQNDYDAVDTAASTDSGVYSDTGSNAAYDGSGYGDGNTSFADSSDGSTDGMDTAYDAGQADDYGSTVDDAESDASYDSSADTSDSSTGDDGGFFGGGSDDGGFFGGGGDDGGFFGGGGDDGGFFGGGDDGFF